MFSLLLLLAGATAAEAAGLSATPNVPGNTVPSWVFIWVIGIVSAVAIVWAAITKILWDRGNQVSALSEQERNQLQQLYDWHNQRDDDQVPLWYVPRSWLALIRSLQRDHADVKSFLSEISRQNEEVIADLRKQLQESRGHQAQQHIKMLKLAVRVQRAVEALAGLQPPDIEGDLDDEEPRS